MALPMLDEHEWELIHPLLQDAIQDIKRYREAHGVSIAEAKEKGYGLAALALYRSLTGFAETNPDAIWHHRLSLFGPPCAGCGKPLRTPQARMCAACGVGRSNSSLHTDAPTAARP
jgi:hypothetical protein